MIKAVLGKKGSGKTKKLIEVVNEAAKTESGNVVFISDENSRMFDLDLKVRLIDISQFGNQSYEEFFGFICGIIAQNFDISYIFVDRLLNIVGDSDEKLEGFFEKLESLSKNLNVKFMATISRDAEELPAAVAKYSI